METLTEKPLFYAVVGAAVMLVLAYINLATIGSNLTLRIIILPCTAGFLGGYLLGSTRQKWQEKSRQLDVLTRELEQNLAQVKDQRELSENLQRMVNRIPLPMYLKNLEGRYLMANAHYEALAGKTWPEIEGKTDYEIFPSLIADLFQEQDGDVVSSGSDRTFEETVPLPAGIVTFQTFKFPLQDASGNIYAVGGVCIDITKLKEAEDRLASRQGRLDVMLRHTEEGVITVDCDGHIEMFNAKAGELTGHDEQEAKGQMLDVVYQPKDPATGADLSIMRQLSGGNQNRIFESRDVFLRTRFFRTLPVTQKSIVLLDRFGQNMGLLIMFRVVEVRTETPGSGQFDLEPEKIQRAEASGSSPGQTVNRPKILVMDDDPLVRKTLGLMLDVGGYDFLKAKHGAEAIALYREHLDSDSPVDVVIMDLTVPGGMGGVEATKEILALDPAAKIIVASGYSNNRVMANFQDYGFSARVEKPYALQKLNQALEMVLNRGA